MAIQLFDQHNRPLVRVEPALKAGRPSQQADRQRLSAWAYQSLIPRTDTRDWRVREKSSVLATLRIVCDRDPDASQALNNLLLFMGRGYETEARRPGSDTLDTDATAYLRAWDATVGQEYGGGMDNLKDVVNITLISQGAMALELELSADLAAVVDAHPVDPARIVMKRERDTGRLMRGVLGDPGTGGADREGFLELPPRQFRYVPLHPWVDDPYGRSLFLAALTAIFFKVQLLTDLEAVVHNQGFPRMDVKVLLEAVLNTAPEKLKLPGKEVELKEHVDGLLAQIIDAYNALEVDDTFVHFDNVEVTTVKGASDTINFDVIRQILDTQIIAGLKQLPSFLGRNEGSTSTHATVQFRAFALLVESLQRRTKRLIEWAQTTALQVAGFQATAHVTFEQLQTSERLSDAQAFETEVRAWGDSIDRGLATPNEGAQALFHHDAVAEVTQEDSNAA